MSKRPCNDVIGNCVQETSPKRPKIERDVVHRTLNRILGGNPTKSRLQQTKLSILKELCQEFSLVDEALGEKLKKKEYIQRIVAYMESLELLWPNAMDEVAQGPSPSVKIRLYRNASDFETNYLTEVEVARLPCGGLKLCDLPLLLNVDEVFEIIENTRYKPISISDGKVHHDMLEILLQNHDYIRVTFV